ncbi:carbonic anhydrase [Halobacteriales archaeon SW_7_65_23]|nr:MAG: carbonic anhydrase [Halobacteriales archaeon SW_7_65_23]
MSKTTLAELLERNAAHADSLPQGYFDAVEADQHPAAVSICCSDSRVAQEGMWDISEPGWLFTPSTIGNQVWDRYDGENVVDGSVVYPIAYAGTDIALVVGHTGCGAVTAALDAVQNGEQDEQEDGDGDADDRPPAGVEKWLDLLVPVVEDGLADDRVDPDADTGLVDQLVEYNVDRQAAFLEGSDVIPADTTVYGFVYDFQGVYGDVRGRAYLVNADGETAVAALRELVPAAYEGHVRRLL